MQLPKKKQTIAEFEESIKSRELIVWGRGGGKNNACQKVCDQYDVKYIVDSNDELCDQTIGRVRVYQPSKLYAEDPAKIVILICTAEKYFKEIVSELLEIADFTIFFWNVLTNDFLNSISGELYDNRERIEMVKRQLYDDCSKKIFQEVINRRICGMNTGYSDLKIQNDIQYLFQPALMSKRTGILLDLGGYIGDSVDRFVNFLSNDISTIYTFEALPENIKRLEDKKETLGQYWRGALEIFPYAVSDREGEIVFYETEKRGACFSPEFRGMTKYTQSPPVRQFMVKTVAIDDIIGADEKIRFIKMDIEGAEYEALLGARKTIMRETPGLAISIYHNAVDYYRLAELIKEYVPGYKMAVRHHKDKHVDTVLYAWI